VLANGAESRETTDMLDTVEIVPEPKRVVITGLGAVTAAGSTTPDFWSALLEGRSCLSPIAADTLGVDRDHDINCGRIANYEGPAALPDRVRAQLSRSALFALDASIQAITDAQVSFNPENAYQVGAIIGTAHPSSDPGAGSDGWAFLSSGIAGVTTGLNIAGPSFTISAGGASGAIAILHAASLIRAGELSVAIAGGAEAPLTPAIGAAYDAAGLLATDSDGEQRPFDLRRSGALLGEGAGVLVLEDREVATQRGARIYAELVGGAQTAGPRADGAPPTDVDISRHAIGDALRDSAKTPYEIDLILTAGTGTVAGDKRETDVLERSFGARVQDLYITAVTPTIGYTIGAAGALAAIAATLAISEGITPPHATYAEPDPECKLDVARKAQPDHLYGSVVNAYSALGQNASLLIMKHHAETGDTIAVL